MDDFMPNIKSNNATKDLRIGSGKLSEYKQLGIEKPLSE